MRTRVLVTAMQVRKHQGSMPCHAAHVVIQLLALVYTRIVRGAFRSDGVVKTGESKKGCNVSVALGLLWASFLHGANE